ncbi:hypothetical protein RR48_05511 [Papilio machaon]|uniref:Helicase C-terminal domain-containing protein n=1 Tax=Papilio machaon TaxID=76193 RepID=A0A0N1I927_PAPMA|nr:hypothetical protein RR48_05511 [Papilio machaon]
MSGRAGRRGLDDKGIVILMIDQKITPAVSQNYSTGKADPINSAFHLTYNMVLNLLRVEEINPEYMLERSFFQFQNQASIPDLIDKVTEKQKQYDKLSLDQEKSIAEYCGIRAQLDLLAAKFRGFITRPEYLKPFLQPGRLVKVKTEKHEYDWGIIVNFKHNTAKGKKQKEENPLTAEQAIIVDILLHVKKWEPSDLDTKFPCPPGEALFATETFAMGLNMPARTVVFTNCQKFDGKDFRFITSGEYIQMSGRAGRRGLDDKGIVILMIDQKITPAVVKTTVQGKADPINSAFHLTYNMVKTEKHEYDWGIIVNFKHNTAKGKKQKEENPLTAEQAIIVDILLHVKKWEPSDLDTKFPCPPGETGEVEVVPVLHTLINQISSLRVYYPKDLRPPDNRKSVLKTIGEVKKRFPEGPPLLNPIKDMKIDDPVFKKCVENIKILEEKLYEHPLHKDENRTTLISAYEKKQEYLEELNSAKAELKKAKSILHMDELKKRKRVLRRLGYCTTSDVIHLKGRIACELSSADELLLTELIFNGVFNSLSAEQSASLVSCFVCDENASQDSNTGEELRGVLRQLQEFARRIAKVSIDCNMQLDEDEYVAKFKCTLMDIVLAWCKGATFLDICKMTDVFEGSIIRCIRRLEEVLRQLCQAAKSIGNTDLEEKFSSAITMLKRDIIFAASLYM